MKQAPIDLTSATRKVRRFLLGLDREGKPFSAYDEDEDTIVVTLARDYKVSKQCSESPIVLFDEDHEDSGIKPIVGFQIVGVRKICWNHGISMQDLRATQVLVVLGRSSNGLCKEVATDLAVKFVERHGLDKIEF